MEGHLEGRGAHVFAQRAFDSTASYAHFYPPATALNKLIEASKRVQHDKQSWSKAANVAARAAALEAEKLTKRAEKAEAEQLRSQVTTLKAALEAEKQRSAKQQALSGAAVQAANKRAAQFEQLYEHAKAVAAEERDKVQSFRVAAVELNRQLEYAGPAGAIPLNLLMSATDAGIRSARRSIGGSPSGGSPPVRSSTAAATSRGVGAGTPSPSGAARGGAAAGKSASPSVSSASKGPSAKVAPKAATTHKNIATSSAKKAPATATLSALLQKQSPRTSAVAVEESPAAEAAAA